MVFSPSSIIYACPPPSMRMSMAMAAEQSTKSSKVLRVWELLDANDSARRAYKRVLAARPTMPEVAKNVICVLLWLETTMGVVNLVSGIMEMSNNPKHSLSLSLSLLIKEADGLYSYLLDAPDDALPEALVCNIPTIVSICSSSSSRLAVDFRFFKFNRDLTARGVAVIRDTVAALVFDDDLHAMLRRFEDELDSSSSERAPAPAPELMEVFVPSSRTPAEDWSTVFVAFSESKPGDPPHGITAQDILNHFERVYGFPRYIERVETEQPPCAGHESKHGIIVFKSPQHRKEAMFDQTSALFRIKSYDIWLHCYMPAF